MKREQPTLVEIPIRLPGFVLIVCAIFAAASLFCVAARGEWYEYSPPGSVDGQGILADVLSRCGKPAYFQQKYADDIATQCHEATHITNNRICNKAGQQAFYVGGGRCCMLPEPLIPLSVVARYVPAKYHGQHYSLYLVQQPSSQPIINSMPLYVLDEWTSAVNGCQAAREQGVSDTGDAQMAIVFCHFADALVEAVKRHDPQYAQLAELIEFVDWQRQRAQKIAGAR